MSAGAASRRSESGLLKKIRTILLNKGVNRSYFLSSNLLSSTNFDLNISIIFIDILSDSKDFQSKFNIPKYLKQMRTLYDHYNALSDTLEIDNYTVSAEYEASPTDSNTLEVLFSLKNTDADIIKTEIEEKIKIPSILLDTREYGLSTILDINVFFDLSIDALLELAAHINFIPSGGAKTANYHVMPDPSSSSGPGTKNEVILKYCTDDSKCIYESELADIFYSAIESLYKLKKLFLEMLSINIELDSAQANDASSEELGEINLKLSTKDSEIRNLIYKINKIINKVSAINPKNYYYYYMTRDTEFSAEAVYKLETLSNTKKIQMCDSNPHVLSACERENEPRCIIRNNIVANNAPFFATADQLEGIVRAHKIFTLFILIRNFCFCAHEMTSYLLCELSKQNLKQMTVLYERFGPVRYLGEAILAGVSLKNIQNILDNSILKYKWMRDISPPEKSHHGKSKSLYKFLRKIAMPIDISGTDVPSAEKAVAARLRELGRYLSTKYNIDYINDPGAIVLSSMRKSDEPDDIMLDVVSAIEDCFGLIDRERLNDEEI